MDVYKFQKAKNGDGVDHHALLVFGDIRIAQLARLGLLQTFPGRPQDHRDYAYVPPGKGNTPLVEMRLEVVETSETLGPRVIEPSIKLVPNNHRIADDNWLAAVDVAAAVAADVEHTWSTVLSWLPGVIRAVEHEHPRIKALADHLDSLQRDVVKLEEVVQAKTRVLTSQTGPDKGDEEIVILDDDEAPKWLLRACVGYHDQALILLIQDLAMIRSAIEDLNARLAALERWAYASEPPGFRWPWSGPEALLRRLVTRPPSPEVESAAEPADDDDELPF